MCCTRIECVWVCRLTSNGWRYRTMYSSCYIVPSPFLPFVIRYTYQQAERIWRWLTFGRNSLTFSWRETVNWSSHTPSTRITKPTWRTTISQKPKLFKNYAISPIVCVFIRLHRLKHRNLGKLAIFQFHFSWFIHERIVRAINGVK